MVVYVSVCSKVTITVETLHPFLASVALCVDIRINRRSGLAHGSYVLVHATYCSKVIVAVGALHPLLLAGVRIRIFESHGEELLVLASQRTWFLVVLVAMVL